MKRSFYIYNRVIRWPRLKEILFTLEGWEYNYDPVV